MKKLLVFFMAVSLMTACNNNKDKGRDRDKNAERNKDDYRNNDVKEADDREDEKKENSGGSWSSLEKNAFLTNCVSEGTKGGQPEDVMKRYCSCMMDRLQGLYPDPKDAAGLTEADLQSPEMTKMATECLTNAQ